MTLSEVILEWDIAYFLGSCLDKMESLILKIYFCFSSNGKKTTKSEVRDCRAEREVAL